MTWFDLSVPLRTGMPVYPGDPEVRIASALTVEADGANVLSLGLGSHSGTHADAPLHVGDGWAALDELPLSLFGGVAEIVDVRDVARGGAITAAHLAGIAPAGSAGEPGKPGYPGSPEKILLLHTGCAAAWGTEEYLKHPWLEAAAAQLIVDRGYRAVGLDALSVDPTSPGATHGDQQGNQDGGPAGGGFPAHAILAGNGCIIVENLTGLEQVQRATDAGSDVELFLFPLNIPGADGAPIRAVARPLPAAALQPAAPRDAQPRRGPGGSRPPGRRLRRHGHRGLLCGLQPGGDLHLPSGSPAPWVPLRLPHPVGQLARRWLACARMPEQRAGYPAPRGYRGVFAPRGHDGPG